MWVRRRRSTWIGGFLHGLADKNLPDCGICAMYLHSQCTTLQKIPHPHLLKICLQNPLGFQEDKVVRAVCKPLPCDLSPAPPWGLWHSFLHPLTGLFYPSPDHQLHPSKVEPLASPTHLYSRPPQGKISPPSATTSITLMNSKNQSLIDKNIFNQSMRHLEHRSSLSSSASVFLYKRKQRRLVAGQRGQVVSEKENRGNAFRWYHWKKSASLFLLYQSSVLVCRSMKNIQQWQEDRGNSRSFKLA